MKKVISSLLMLTVLVLCLLPLQASAEETASGSCGVKAKWAFDEATGTLTISGTGAVKVSTFADDSDDENTPWEQYNAQIIKLVISEGITSVNDYAFAGMQALVSVEMAGTVTTLGSHIFGGCENLTTVKLSENLSGIPECAFNYCSTLASIHIPASVKRIDSDAFYDCDKLVSVTMADGVETIGYSAFYDCDALSSIVLPDTLVKIEFNAFAGCDSLVSVSIPASVEIIEGNAFECCGALTSITIPDSIIGLGKYVFQECTALTEVTLPQNLTRIPDGFFYNCDSLASVHLPESLTEIGSDAFKDCSGLESVTFPASLESIESRAYAGCTNLSEIIFAGSAPTVSDDAFQEVSAVVSYPAEDPSWNYDALVSLGDTLTWVYDGPIASGNCGEGLTWALDNAGVLSISGTGPMENQENARRVPWYTFREGITKVEISEGITTIGDLAFYGCINMEDISVPSTVTYIGKRAFNSCEKLSSFSVSEKVSQIGEGAFFGCTGMTVFRVAPKNPAYVSDEYGVLFNKDKSVLIQAVASISGNYTIPDSVTEISDAAFANQKKMTGITVPDTVTALGNEIFSNCNSLTSVELPDTITSFGMSTFKNCTSLAQIRLPKALKSMHWYTFAYCSSLTEIQFPEGFTTIAYADFAHCTSLKRIIMPDSVTVIETEAFTQCTALTDVTLSANLTQIGAMSFSGCTSLQKIVIPENVESIGVIAFSDCASLTEIVFTGNAPKIEPEIFSNVTATVTFPAADATWTSEICQNYGGNLTWVCYCSQGHIAVTDPAVEATCTATGLREGRHCDECGEILLAQTKIPMTEHTYDDRVCKYCGAVEPVKAPKITASNKLSSGKPRLTWDPVDGAVKYQIFRSTTKNGTYTQVWTQKSTTYVNTKAEAGTLYYYKVKSVDVNGNVSDFSNRVSRTCDLARPVVKTSNDAATGKVKLTWDAVEGAKSYKVYRATSKGGRYVLMKTLTDTTYINNSAKAGTKYYYWVKAIHENSNANSVYSTVVSRTCDLARPTITVKRNNAGKPRISWEKVEGAAKYEVWRATSKNGKYTRIATTKNTYQVNKNAVAGKTYYYKVKAIHSNTNANSAFSTIKYIKAK